MSQNKITKLKATVSYEGSTQTATVSITPYVVKSAYFATKEESIVYETVKRVKTTYTVVSGDNLSKIASKNKPITVVKIKTDNGLTSNNIKVGDTLNIIQEDTKKEKEKKVTFTPLTKASVGDEVYIVLETKDLQGKTLKINVRQGKEKVIAEKDKELSITQNDTVITEIKARVGELADTEEYLNKEYLQNLAVVKVTLAPKEEKDIKDWNTKIKEATDKKTYLYLLAEVDIKEKVKYNGVHDGSNFTNHFLNEEGQWLEFHENRLPPWMEIAWKEYKDWSSKKWTEKKGDGLTRANKYIKKADANFKANKDAWCACFIHWVLKETNTSKSTNFSTVIDTPSGSQNYWHSGRYPNKTKVSASLENPPYGVITVLQKGNQWKGHVGFLMNFKEKGGEKYAYLLGGNQNNKVCVQEYKVYKDGSKIKYKTKKGTVYTLKGYVYPKEYEIDDNKKHKNDYKTKDYTVEDAISTI